MMLILGIFCVLSTAVYLPQALRNVKFWRGLQRSSKIMTSVNLCCAVFVYVVWGTHFFNWIAK